VLPCRSDGCNSSPRLALSMITSGWYCPVIWTDGTIFTYLCLWRKSNFLSISNERPDMLPWRPNGCYLEFFETSRHWWASERMIELSRRNLEIRLLWLGICTESSFEHLKPLFWNEKSEINGILEYVATLHNSDFVKQNAANHKLTLSIQLSSLFKKFVQYKEQQESLIKSSAISSLQMTDTLSTK
jgi:hypothetical protein